MEGGGTLPLENWGVVPPYNSYNSPLILIYKNRFLRKMLPPEHHTLKINIFIKIQILLTHFTPTTPQAANGFGIKLTKFTVKIPGGIQLSPPLWTNHHHSQSSQYPLSSLNYLC